MLEWLNGKPAFAGAIAAFASWDVFPFIINSERSGVYVNAGWQRLDIGSKTTLAECNRVAEQLPKYWAGVRYDAFTFTGAVEYLKARGPRLLYMALGETDDWAHSGRYDLYLQAATNNDQFIRELWETAQSIEQYRGKTSLVITTDHGRGDGREGWKHHNAAVPGSHKMWVGIMGPDTAAVGICKDTEVTQSQIPATIAALLDQAFSTHDDRIAEPIKSVLRRE